MKNKKLFSITILLLIISLHLVDFSKFSINEVRAESVHIPEDEDEDEDEDDREHDDEDDEDEDEYEDEYKEYVIYTSNEVPTNEVVTEVPVTSYVTYIDTGYNIDTDGDELVDAIDPHPQTPEVALFTDSDNDSVPDATDAYPGEDDFVYIMFEDANANGIIDFLEP